PQPLPALPCLARARVDPLEHELALNRLAAVDRRVAPRSGHRQPSTVSMPTRSQAGRSLDDSPDVRRDSGRRSSDRPAFEIQMPTVFSFGGFGSICPVMDRTE